MNTRIGAGAGTHPRTGPRLAVWLLTLGLAAAAAALYVGVVRPGRHAPILGGPTWLALAAAFAVADAVVVHVNIGRHAHTFSLADLPLAAALLLMPHSALLTSRLVGGLAVLVFVRRATLVKVAFNLAMWGFGVAAALAIWRLGHGGGYGQRAALVVLIAVLVSEVASALAITAVIRLSGDKVDRAAAARGVLTIGLTGIANTSFVLMSVAVLHTDWRGLWTVLVVAGFLAAAQRSHVRLQRRHGALERLNDAARSLGRDLQADSIAHEIVIAAAQTLNAASATLELLAVGERTRAVIHFDGTTVHRLDGPVAAESQPARESRQGDCISTELRSHGNVLGYLTVTGSATVRTYGADEQHLLNALAQHASTALTNGRLADELRLQVSDNEHQATHDPLTGLPNRLMFERVVAALLGSGRSLAVLLFDLDRFKEVNDTLGHAAGDALLKDVGERLKSAVPDALCIARLGGDEFTILLTNADADRAFVAAESARAALLNPVEVHSVPVSVDASIGIALAPEHGDSCDDLLRHADVAMYAAKDGRNGIAVYDTSIDHNDASRLGMVAELREAVESGQLFLQYQPKVALRGALATPSVEALVRWDHPVRGLVPPDAFIGVAEQTGIILALTDWVLDTALAQCRRWLDDGLDMTVSVNLSPRVLRDPGFPSRLRAALARHRVPAARLTLEVTESAIMDDVEHGVDVLWLLRRSGVHLSIDDLGVGQSSLAYLKRLPVHEVKVDKSFVLNMADDPSDDAIVCAVVGLAHRMNMTIVAEGVETQRTRDRLVEIGCDVAQGYWYSRPLPAEDVAPWFSGYVDQLERAPRLRVAAMDVALPEAAAGDA